MPLSLNTCTACAIWPISSVGPSAGTSTVQSRSARRSMVPVMPMTGLAMAMPMIQARPRPIVMPATDSISTSISVELISELVSFMTWC